MINASNSNSYLCVGITDSPRQYSVLTEKVQEWYELSVLIVYLVKFLLCQPIFMKVCGAGF